MFIKFVLEVLAVLLIFSVYEHAKCCWTKSIIYIQGAEKYEGTICPCPRSSSYTVAGMNIIVIILRTEHTSISCGAPQSNYKYNDANPQRQ